MKKKYIYIYIFFKYITSCDWWNIKRNTKSNSDLYHFLCSALYSISHNFAMYLFIYLFIFIFFFAAIVTTTRGDKTLPRSQNLLTRSKIIIDLNLDFPSKL